MSEKVQVIPADPELEKKAHEQEKASLELRKELSSLYQILPQIDIRIEELENVLYGLQERIDRLKSEKSTGEARKLELERILRQ